MISLFCLAIAALRPPTLYLVPWPKSFENAETEFNLGRAVSVEAKSKQLLPLVAVLSGELQTGWGVTTGKSSKAKIVLSLDPKLKQEEYSVSAADSVQVRGGSYRAVAMGTATVLQALREDEQGLVMPRIQVLDEPSMGYRGLMVDVARRYHSIAVLKQCVELCRFYKLRYLQLHLSDDQAFTFPSKAFPLVTTVNEHGGPSYTLAELKGLVKYADDRGVTIVPEMDVPGHSAALNRAMPDLFKIKGTVPYEHHATINFANDKVVAAVDTLIGEMCDVFKSSPYFHMGGDEADYAYASQHPDFKAAFAKYGLSGDRASHEIYRLFIGRVDEMVKKRKKRLIVWEGFNKEPASKFPIPKDVLVMAFESAYYLPTELLSDGYQVVNAAWTPLYVVNKHVWQPRKVYDWRPTQFGRFSEDYSKTVWFESPSLEGIQGAQVCAWEQPEYSEVSSLRRVVAAMAERVWNPHSHAPYESIEARFVHADGRLGRLLEPVTVETGPLQTLAADAFDLPTFSNSLTVALSARQGGTVRYTLDGTPPTSTSPVYATPLILDATTTLRTRVFKGEVGGEFETSRTFYRDR